MNKLTKEEREEFGDLIFSWLDDNDFSDLEEIVGWVEQKKKQWQEEAYMKGYTDTEDEFNEMFKLKSGRP